MFPLRDNIPTDHFPVVTAVLIALNFIAYFFLQPKTGIDLNGAGLNQQDLMHYGFIPYEITHPGQHCELLNASQVACGKDVADPIATWLTPFTAMFTPRTIWKVLTARPPAAVPPAVPVPAPETLPVPVEVKRAA